ncbi:MAG: polysaccharide biosynthesis tyrosine autokinase [Chitinophagaceae bacterium]
MEESLKTTKSELWSLSLRDLFYKYVRFLPIFVLSVAIALLCAYAYLRYATPIYSTTGTLIIKSDLPNARGDKFDDIFGGGGSGKSQNIQNEIEVLKSKGLMSRVVEKLHLQYSYYVKGKIKTINIYKFGPFLIEATEITDSSQAFTLKIKFVNDQAFKVNNDNTVIGFDRYFKNQFGTFRLIRQGVGPVSKDYTIDYQPTAVAAALYAGSLQVTPKSVGTGILNITMQSTHPNLGADVVNNLLDEYGDYTKELKNKTADQMLDFIDNRLSVIKRELDSVQGMLLRYSQENNLIDIEAQSTNYFANLSEADKAVNEQQLQIVIAEGIEGYLRNKKNEFDQVVVPSSFTLSDATLNELISAYNQLQVKRQELLDSNVPEGNPLVLENKQQIEKIRQSILENITNIKKSYNRTITTLQHNSQLTETQLKIIPYKARGYYELKRQVDNKQALVNILQAKREETAISRASTIANVQIVENAYVSNTPVKPNRRSIQIMAMLAGLAIPALVVFAGEVLNDKVSTRFDIEKITSAPILGEVGHSFSNKTLIVNKTTRSMVAEQFRIVRSNLQYILTKVDKSVILVTSSFSGEGKSFISTNMASVMALAGKKTVILEFDIRKPKVLSGLGMAKGPGITNYLVGKASLEELIKPVPEQENFFILGCGPIPPNPSELLLDKKVEDMFTWLRANFDVIIVDTAPVGMVSDAMTLSKFADCTLYLVRQGHTFKKQVVLIDEFYTENKLPKVSIIINDVKMKAGYGYYGYGRYGYGYGYGYGSYYEEETPPKSALERFLNRFSGNRTKNS